MLVGAALLFWGWQTGSLPVAAVLACILEGSRIVNQRWDFSEADLKRIWNLCSLLFIGALAMALIADQGMGLLDNSPRRNSPAARIAALNKTAKAMFLFFQWLPLVFFPVAAAQAYGYAHGIKLVTFSWFLRRRALRSGAPDAGELNVSFPYFAVCVLAASTSTEHAEFFFAGMTILLVWALWTHRVRRFAPAITAAVILVICAGGYAGNYGMRELQRIVTALDSALLSRFSGRDFDPQRHRSLLGAIGRVKGSSKIVLWVKTDGAASPPLLREACYDQFTSPVWHTSDREFNNTVSESDQATWLLVTNQPQQFVHISRMLPGGRGLLAFPNGAAELRRLPVFVLQTNTMAVLKAGSGPGYVSYDVGYTQGAGIDRPPTAEDERVSPKEEPVIGEIAAELNLAGLTAENPTKAVHAVQKFFQQNFTYSTWLEPPKRSRGTNSPIARFLRETHKGHCEYFASATVLLLRQAKIPARYAVGYSVQEGARGKYVVRDRHAHAWCLAWINGSWTDVDTTPPSWSAIEAARAPWWEPVSDAWTNFMKQFSRLRWSGVNYRKYFMWALAPAVVGVAVLIYRRRQWTRSDALLTLKGKRFIPGLDSEFYLVADRLRELGFDRQPGEALGAWLVRIEASAPRNGVPLGDLLRLHYRYRFDPAGLQTDERRFLREKAKAWLESVGLDGARPSEKVSVRLN
jgi:hypothetical protein